MSAGTLRPGCPVCGNAPRRGVPFCALCWPMVPKPARAELERASKAMGKNPTSRKVRVAYARALDAAAGAVQ